VALGLLQGATELVPVSSSAHLCVVPRVLGFTYPRLGDAERKCFEVALHAGSAPVIAAAALSAGPLPSPGDLALTVLPAAVAGLVLERPIERRLGGPLGVGLAQIAAGLALVAADRRGGLRALPDRGDHVAVGVAQAAALVPGVSRAGAALTAGRMRGLSRPAALTLALQAALPVTAGAAALKGTRMAREGIPEGAGPAMLAGALASLASAAAARGVLRRLRDTGSYAPLAAYRVAFGLAAVLAGAKHHGRTIPGAGPLSPLK
jgi:undecaprenyl-diphosphatase